jgi:hypothetical protein
MASTAWFPQRPIMATKAQKGSFLRKPTPASGQQHTQLTAGHSAGCPRSVGPALHPRVALLSFPQVLSTELLPTAPTPQQAADYTFLLRSPSALQQCRRRLSLVIAAYLPPKLSPSSVYQEGGKGLPPLRSQGSPLCSDPFLRCRFGMDKPLTSFTPLYKSTYRAFCESPVLYFSFASYLALRCIASPEISDRADFPGWLPCGLIRWWDSV